MRKVLELTEKQLAGLIDLLESQVDIVGDLERDSNDDGTTWESPDLEYWIELRELCQTVVEQLKEDK